MTSEQQVECVDLSQLTNFNGLKLEGKHSDGRQAQLTIDIFQAGPNFAYGIVLYTEQVRANVARISNVDRAFSDHIARLPLQGVIEVGLIEAIEFTGHDNIQDLEAAPWSSLPVDCTRLTLTDNSKVYPPGELEI